MGTDLASQHAPAMIRTVPQNRVTELLVMVSRGGPFAEAIFMAFNTAARGGFRDVEESSRKVEEEEEVGKGERMGGLVGGEKDKGDGGEGEGDGGAGEAGGDKGVADAGGAAEGAEALAVAEGASIFGGPSAVNS